MARQRMYVYERAYVDYGSRISRFWRSLWHACSETWFWFWDGPGAKIFEVIITLAIFASAVTLCVLYVQYESDHGRGFSWGMAGVIIVIFAVALILMFSWKPVVHFLARVASGAVASGTILIFSVAALSLALVVFSVYLVVLFVITALSFLVFLPLRAVHELTLLYRRIAIRCPYDDCNAHGMPIYLCPKCGTEYADLQPSFYGIFYHTCRHADGTEAKLPTMGASTPSAKDQHRLHNQRSTTYTRSELPRLCRGCHRPLMLSSIGELSEKPIAIIGGPSVGKTIFMRQAVRQLSHNLNSLPGSTARIDSEEQQRALNKDLADLDSGQVVAKTAGTTMQAFGLALRIPKKKIRSLLYIYDAPGEHFETMARFGQKQVIQHLTGIVLLVDPFATALLSEQAQALENDLKPSQAPFHNIVSVMIAGINQMMVGKRTIDRSAIPLAVVIAKADALPVKDYPFLDNLMPDGSAVNEEDYNRRCRQALEKLGEGGSIRAIEQKFENVRYFACSALGRMPDLRNTSAFTPKGVVSPVMWLLKLDNLAAELKTAR